ncbi:MAG: VIT1/CCC1 transporter family protein [Thermoplasmatota archaeon]
MIPSSGPGHYVRDFVYGALDGGVTTLAIVAGATGAELGARVAVVLGIANLAGDGISMAAGNYLGMRSEIQQAGKDSRVEKPWRHGLATFAAFVAVGALPLLAFLVPGGKPLWWAGGMTAVSLFVVGALRARFVPDRSAWRMGAEMVVIAALAAAAALGVGVAARQLV